MRIVALKHKALAALAALIALSALGGPSTASATGTTVSPTPSYTYFVPGAWFDSGVTLPEGMIASLYPTTVKISDKNLLREGWTIKVDTESMLIDELLDGGVHQPDIMVVQRGVNGTVASPHLSGTMIKAHTVTVSIYANNVTNSWGLGGFQVAVTLPPGLELIKMTAEPAWLASTGRDPWCDGPVQYGNTWWVTCSTTGNWEDGRYPLGPKGSGLIAKVTLLPSEAIGGRAVGLAGQLVNTPAQVIPATVENTYIRVLECPDANLDGRVNSGDLGQVARNLLDNGVDSGATLDDQVNTSQTNIAISDQSLLLLGDTISVDTEQMTVTALHEGTPDTMTVTRAVNNTTAKPHDAGAHIYRATVDGNHDGKKGYTGPRDVNKDDRINSGDIGIVARVFGMVCPVP